MKSAWKSMCVVAALAAIVSSVEAQNLINNGGFESGFTGWTRVDQPGSEGGWLVQSGTVSPVNGLAVPVPPGGVRAAMTDAAGPGSHVLYQDFVVPGGTGPASLSFSLYVGNRANAFFSPSTLDFSTPALNQQFRVDIVRTGADPFSVAVADVLLTIYQTMPGNALVSGYVTIAADLTALFAARPGETLRLRFAEVDNVNIMNIGIDNVSLIRTSTAVPESGGTFGLLCAAVALLAATRTCRGARGAR